MLDYFIPLDFAYQASQNLMVYRMGPKIVTEYTDEFQKYLVNCANMSDTEAKYIFEINLADWLSALVLPYNCADLYKMMLCAKQIGSV